MKPMESRSPIKAAPLRNPGQSIQVEIDNLIDNEYDSDLVLCCLALAFVFFSWIQVVLSPPPLSTAIIATIFAAVILALKVPKMQRAKQRLRLLKQARDGERAVAEYLDTLRDDGCRVLHDLVGDNFNIDHIVIAPQGVFTIETKTISKPVNGDAKIHYDGERITIGRYEPSRDPITQARAQASWLKRLLKESTGKDFPVRPVVVFPGWFVERSNGDKGKDVWVLEPKALKSFIRHEPFMVSSEDVSLATFHLKRFIRSTK